MTEGFILTLALFGLIAWGLWLIFAWADKHPPQPRRDLWQPLWRVSEWPTEEDDDPPAPADPRLRRLVERRPR